MKFQCIHIIVRSALQVRVDENELGLNEPKEKKTLSNVMNILRTFPNSRIVDEL